MEIERKFWVLHPPVFLSQISPVAILQGYLAVEKGGNEVRLRAMGSQFFLTVKGAGTLVRGEWEIEIEPAQFEALWPATETRRVVKDRFVFDWEGYTIELDRYLGALEGLWVAEVEFDSRSVASAFTPADWMGPELTELAEFKNKALAAGASWPDLQPLLEGLIPG